MRGWRAGDRAYYMSGYPIRGPWACTGRYDTGNTPVGQFTLDSLVALEGHLYTCLSRALYLYP